MLSSAPELLSDPPGELYERRSRRRAKAWCKSNATHGAVLTEAPRGNCRRIARNGGRGGALQADIYVAGLDIFDIIV
jgi:hypothetical protein